MSHQQPHSSVPGSIAAMWMVAGMLLALVFGLRPEPAPAVDRGTTGPTVQPEHAPPGYGL